MNISNISTSELEEELERRKSAKNKRPQPKDNIDWSPIINFVEESVNEVVNGTYSEESDEAHYLWEEVMTTVYGKDFFEWFNKHAY